MEGQGFKLSLCGFRPAIVRDPDDAVMGTFLFGWLITDNAVTASNLLAAASAGAGIVDPIIRALFGTGANPQVIGHFEELGYYAQEGVESASVLRLLVAALREAHTPQGGTTVNYYNCHEYIDSLVSSPTAGATAEVTGRALKHLETYPIKDGPQIIDFSVDTDVVEPYVAVDAAANIPGLVAKRGACFRRPGSFNRSEYMDGWSKMLDQAGQSAHDPIFRQTLLANYTQRDRVARGRL